MDQSQEDREGLALLSNREKTLLRERTKKEALLKCDPSVRLFSECTKDKYLSVIWACRSLQQDMNECVHKYTTEHDILRTQLEYVRSVRLKQKESNLVQ